MSCKRKTAGERHEVSLSAWHQLDRVMVQIVGVCGGWIPPSFGLMQGCPAIEIDHYHHPTVVRSSGSGLVVEPFVERKGAVGADGLVRLPAQKGVQGFGPACLGVSLAMQLKGLYA